jgi:hypothetical protein
MKKLIVSILSMCLVLSASVVLATPVEIGNEVKFLSTGGTTGGGVFTIYNINQNVNFWSFCLERNEYISIGATYKVAGISDAAVNGGVGGPIVNGGDPLSGKTAWLFYNFTMGTLTEYDGSQAKQDLLQKAIWMLEGELTPVNDNYFYNLATTSSEAWADNYIGPVRVLNLVTASGVKAQDQLIVTPEPLSLLLLGFGLMGVAAVRRKVR